MARSGPVISAGIAVLRPGPAGPELFLVHPGGPFWRNKDEHAWSIPKGEIEPTEVQDDDAGDDDDSAARATARREFAEETGQAAPEGELVALGEIKLSSSKRLRAFAVVGDVDADAVVSNTFELEWPPRSGRHQSFPEVDAGAWYGLDEARTKLHKGQVPLVDHIEAVLDELSL